MIERIFLGGVMKPSYWLAAYKATGSTNWGYGISVNSLNEIFSTGQVDNPSDGTTDFAIISTSGNGSASWVKGLAGSFVSDLGWGIKATQTSIFANGYVANGRGYTTKFNKNGSRIWGEALSNVRFTSIAANESGDNYSCGFGGSSGNGVHLVKRNDSGVIQWQRNYWNGTDTQGAGVGLDASGGVYAGYRNSNGTSGIIKFDASGTFQWQRLFNGSAYGLGVAPDGSIYICGNNVGFELRKYNSSGTLQWTRSLSTNVAERAHSVAFDAQSNIYACGYANVTGSYTDFFIAKYNPSGTLLWQRRLGVSGNSQAYSISVDSLNRILVCGWVTLSGVQNYFIAALPGDGSLTGTYTLSGNSITYAATSLSQFTTGNDAAGTLTNTSYAAPVFNYTVNIQNPTLTTSRVSI